MFQFNKILFAFFISVILLANSANLFAHEHVHVHEQAKGKVTVENAWARATFALAKTGAVYLSIDNQSKNDIKLLSVSVDPSVASDAQLHEILMQDEMMLMREAEDGFEISAGSSLEFLTGGKHIMLVDLEKPLSRGENFVLSLIFEKNKVMRVPIEVKDAR
jgi:copper(I)-binding protein